MIADLIYTTLWPDISQVKIQYTAMPIYHKRLHDVGKDHVEIMRLISSVRLIAGCA